MKKLMPILLMVFPVFLTAQVQDTATVAKEVDSLLQVSNKLTGERKFEEALLIIEKAEKRTLDVFGKNHQSYASCLIYHGSIFDRMGLYREAEPLYLEAKDVQEKVLGKYHTKNASILNSLGILNFNMGNYEAAEKFLIEAKNIREKIFGKEHPDYATSLHNLAILYSTIGKFETAEVLWLESKSIRQRVLGKEHREYASSLNSLAILYYTLGQYNKAELMYLESKNIKERVLGKTHPEYAQSLNNLGILYRDMGRYDKAELLHLECKAIREKILGNKHPEFAQSLNNLAALYLTIGQYDRTESLLLESKKIREETQGKEHINYSHALDNLAILYRDIKQYEKAESLFLESINIREKTLGNKHPFYANSIDNLASLYRLMHQDEKAKLLWLESKDIREKALGKDHPEYAQSLNNLAILNNEAGRYQLAEPLFLEAKTIYEKALGKQHSDYVNSIDNLAILYWKTNRLINAQQQHIEASAIQRLLLSKAMRHLSEKELTAYVNLFVNNLNKNYSLAQFSAEVGLNFTATCYDQSLFYKGFLLTASNQIKHLASSDSTSQIQFELLTSYNRRLAKEYSKPIAERKGVEDLEAKANELEKELVRTVAGFGEALRQVNWQEVHQQLKVGEAAVEFVHYQFYKPDLTDSTMYAALVLRPGDPQPHFVPLFEEKQLNQLLPATKKKQTNEFIAKLYTKSVDKKNSPGLYELVWKPLDSLLANTKTIYCAPSGLLHRINLSAIPIDNKTRIADRFELVQVSSTRSLVVPDLTNVNTSNDAILFGGIQYQSDTTAIKRDTAQAIIATASNSELSFRYADRSEPLRGEIWRYLPGTEKEVQQIQALLKQSKFSVQVHRGQLATEELFKSIDKAASSPRILHLATHGFFFPDPKDTIGRRSLELNNESVFKISDHPMIRSGLLMAGGNYAWQKGSTPKPNMEDGILTAYEISQMNLSNTQLVVLSACETGLGDIQGNEGVYGLQRAFKIAGVKYLIMSLWRVPDQQTQELMTAFYQQWLQGGSTIRQAFYDAQQKMREKYKYPHLWAGFVLVE